MNAKKQLDQIRLQNLLFWAKHGVYAEEKEQAQQFRVDITLFLDLQPAAAADDIAQTVDYAAFYLRLKELVEGEHCGLLETLCLRICHLALREAQVWAVEAAVCKCRAKAPDGSFFSPQIVLRRERGQEK